MNLKTKLGYTVSIIGISLSGSAMADLYVYGFSDLNSSNGLNITTNSGDFFVPNSDSGWWTSSFGHDASNKNYIAGTCCGTGNHNDYFTFDLSGVSGNVISASFELYSYTVNGSSIEFQLFDVTSPLSEVRATGINETIYTDLMTGTSYGSFIYNPSDSDQFRTLVLNADGISAINNAIGGEFGVGGAITGGIPPIPEPETYAMWLAGLGLLGFFGYRRKGPNINSLVH